MIALIQRFWRRRQRSIDISILWPMIKEQTGGDLPLAHEVFFMHAFNDTAWTSDYGDDLWQTIQRLR